MHSRASSVCSEKFANSKGRIQSEAAQREVFSRQYVPVLLGSQSLTKASFPYRMIGTLSYINVEKNQFGVHVKDEKLDSGVHINLIHDNYANKKEEDAEKDQLVAYNCQTCKFATSSAVVIGGIYALRDAALNKIVRVRVLGFNHGNTSRKVKVVLLDYGMVTETYDSQLIMLDKDFAEGKFKSAFALACQLPDTRLLNSAPFPKLENFNIGDHVEVYVLSDGEPCLAVFGSLVTGPNAIPRELFTYGIAPYRIDSVNRALNGIIPVEKETSKGWASNKWSYGAWTLVTVLSSEDLGKVAIRDVFTSLRFLRLQQSINRCYKKQSFSEVMKIDPATLCSGTPVIVYYMALDTYIRGTVTSVHHYGIGCDVEALDIPNLVISDIPTDRLCHPSSVLLNVPPLVYYFNIMKGYDSMKRTDCGDYVKLGCDTVAIMKLSGDHSGAQLEVNKNERINSVIENYILQLQKEAEKEAEQELASEINSLSGNRIDSLFDDDDGDDDGLGDGNVV